jgi:hypothetical protein
MSRLLSQVSPVHFEKSFKIFNSELFLSFATSSMRGNNFIRVCICVSDYQAENEGGGATRGGGGL